MSDTNTSPDFDLDDIPGFDDDNDSFEEAAGSDAAGDDDFAIDVPPVLCGVLRMHIDNVRHITKDRANKAIVTFKSQEPDSRGETYEAWYDFKSRGDLIEFQRLLTGLGIKSRFETVKRPGRRSGSQLKWEPQNGARGFKALKGKEGLFVLSTYFHKNSGEERPTFPRGKPKSDKNNPSWGEYADRTKLSEKQLEIIAKSNGVIPREHHAAFEGVNDTGDDEF